MFELYDRQAAGLETNPELLGKTFIFTICNHSYKIRCIDRQKSWRKEADEARYDVCIDRGDIIFVVDLVN